MKEHKTRSTDDLKENKIWIHCRSTFLRAAAENLYVDWQKEVQWGNIGGIGSIGQQPGKYEPVVCLGSQEHPGLY